MKIVLTGSLGNIGRPLTQQLVQKGHTVTVISSQAGRRAEIEALGATAAIGKMEEAGFLAATFQGADAVYLMETIRFSESDYLQAIDLIVQNYKQAVLQSGVGRVVHLSSIGAHTDQGNGILAFHHHAENVLRQLPEEVSITFLRPVGFYTNILRSIPGIKTRGAIFQNFGGDKKEPWVSPLDIAEAAAEELEKPHSGRSVRYLASDEVSPNEIARALGEAIGMPELTWQEISDEEMLHRMLSMGVTPQIAEGFVAMQAAQRTGVLYADYYENPPMLGKVKLADFAREFAEIYGQ